MIITEKNKEKIYSSIIIIYITYFFIEYLRYILTQLRFGSLLFSDLLQFVLFNILFICAYQLQKQGKPEYSKNIFFTSVMVFFAKQSIYDIHFFMPKEIIVGFPVIYTFSFEKRRYIVLYSSALLAVIISLQLFNECFSEKEFSSLVFAVIFVSTVCILYKFYAEKIIEIKNDSYNMLYNTTFSLLGRVSELKDDETQNHQERVGIIISTIMKKMKTSSKYSRYLTNSFIIDVVNGSCLHDIGKIAIEDSVLLKKGKYTIEEHDRMKRHTVIGAEILSETGKKSGLDVYDTAIEIVKYHHEKWDGSGYPEGLKGVEIPLSARIMAVADVYDALVSRRCYKKAFSHETAYEIIVGNSAKHFDPDIVKCFKKTHQDIYSRIRNLL